MLGHVVMRNGSSFLGMSAEQQKDIMSQAEALVQSYNAVQINREQALEVFRMTDEKGKQGESTAEGIP